MRKMIVALVACVALAACTDSSKKSEPTRPHEKGDYAREEAKTGVQAFRDVYAVLEHPRCMNCHPAGDVPLQGDDSHPHAQNVRRGPDGHGVTALKCAACHQEQALAGDHMPPGAPGWHLPPPETPMVFEGKSPAELARQLKDPKQTGGRTLDDLCRHVTLDTLVRSCWANGRTPPPLAHDEFAKKFREWVDKGAPVPE